MLVTFKSHASPSVVMPEPLTHYLLGAIGKHYEVRGVITAAELGNAIAKLEAAISVDKKNRAERDSDSHHHEDEEEYAPHDDPVGLAQRAFPFLGMLRAAHTEGTDIVWGV